MYFDQSQKKYILCCCIEIVVLYKILCLFRVINPLDFFLITRCLEVLYLLDYFGIF